MKTSHEILGVEITNLLLMNGDEIQQSYDALVSFYHPQNHPDDIRDLSLLLTEPDQLERIHRGYCLAAIETIAATKGQTLPSETLTILNDLLINDAYTDDHEQCCRILAYSAYHGQLLPESALRQLEQILESGPASLSNLAAAALSCVHQQKQALSDNIMAVVEAAFFRTNGIDIGLFLAELLKTSNVTTRTLSDTSYKTLSRLLLKDIDDAGMQNCYLEIIKAAARLDRREIPGIIFDALMPALENPDIQVNACQTLVRCLAREQNRQQIKPALMAPLITYLEQAALDKNSPVSHSAACALGYLDLNNPNIPHDLLVAILGESLEDSVLCEAAVAHLHGIFSFEKLGLVGKPLLHLAQISQERSYPLQLRIKAIELMGLSARNNHNPFVRQELNALHGVLHEKNPKLTRCVLTSLGYHLNNLGEAKALPHPLMKQLFAALTQADNALATIQLLKVIMVDSEERQQARLLNQFLAHAAKTLRFARRHAYDELQQEALALLDLAEQYYPDDVQRLRYVLEEDVIDEEEDDAEEALENQPSATPHSCSEGPKSTTEKTIPQLLAELRDDENNDAIKDLLKDHVLSDKLDDIAFAHEADSALFPLNKSIKQWDKADCLRWAHYIKSHPEQAREPEFFTQMIAVLSQGMILTTTNPPRMIQLLALLIVLDAKDRGRLAQISTGEGKSMIVAMLAAIKALQGEKVDVVSSSPILAFRDAEGNAPFFQLFGLTVASNWHPHDDHNLLPGYKPCYDADIVYGDANNFQFDLLRHEYKCEKTRGDKPYPGVVVGEGDSPLPPSKTGRPYQTVIVDEVDSMLLDESMKIASLGTHKPLMAELELVFISAWNALKQRCEEIKEKIKQGDMTFPINPDTGEVYTQFDYLTAVVEQSLLKIINDPKSTAPIPKHLHDFALSQAPHWAKSAVMAHENYTCGRNYVITTEDGHDIIAPVDHDNTGVIHPNSAWDDGLQQFLQLKHGLEFKAENLTASFISNVAFFKRYGSTIYGVTGTLGPSDAQQLLKDVYKLDLVFIPTYKEKQFKEISGISAENSEEWLAAVVQRAKQEADSGRAVLVICESINAAHAIEDALRKANVKKVCCYTRNDNDENLVILDQVKSGHVISATNLAGRGTDLETTDEVEENGGVFVLLTYLPRNKRIEDQALGRTSRKGHQGSGQLVVNKQEATQQLASIYPDLGTAESMESLKAWRDLAEEQMLLNVKDFELKKIAFKDALFADFCEFTYTLRQIDDQDAKLDDVEEQWGFWLKNTVRAMGEEQTFDEAAIRGSFEQFKQRVHAKYIAEDIENPAQCVKLGNTQSDLEQAKKDYQKAIAQDKHGAAAAQAHYQLAHTYLLQRNKTAAITELQAAKAIIKDHIIPSLEAAYQLLYWMKNNNLNAELEANCAQLQRRSHLLKIQLGYIDRDLMVIKSSHRDIERTGAKRLEDFFDERNRPIDEIRALSNTGLKNASFYDIREKEEPKKKKKRGFGAWIRRAVVAVAGVCQIVVGVCLTVAGNANWGSALIQMGVSDILFAVRSAIEDTACSWKEYRAHKIVSTAIILATVGIDVLREGATAAKESAKESAKSAVGQSLLQKTAKDQVIQAVRSGIIRDVVHFGLSKVAKGVLANYKEEIKRRVRSTLLLRFNQADFKQQINALLAVDACNVNNEQAEKLQQLAYDIMKPKHNALASMGESIFKGALANQIPVAGVVMQAVDIANALDKIANLCDNFCDDFSARLSYLVYQCPKAAELLHTALAQRFNTSVAKNVIDLLKQQQVIDAKGAFSATWQTRSANTIHLGQYNEHKTEILQVCDELHARFMEDNSAIREKLYDSMINQVNRCVMSSLHNEVATPLFDVVMGPRIQKWVSDSLAPKKQPEMMNVAPAASNSQLANSTTKSISAYEPAEQQDVRVNAVPPLNIPVETRTKAALNAATIESPKKPVSSKPRSQKAPQRAIPAKPSSQNQHMTFFKPAESYFKQDAPQMTPIPANKLLELSGQQKPLTLWEMHQTTMRAIEKTSDFIASGWETIADGYNGHLDFAQEFSPVLHNYSDTLKEVSPGLGFMAESLIARPFDTAVYMASDIKGVVQTGGDLWHCANHPYECLIKPTYNLVADTVVIVGYHAPMTTFNPGFSDFHDVKLWDAQQRLRDSSVAYQHALGHMQARGDDLAESAHSFVVANSFEKARMATRLGANLLLTHKGMGQLEHAAGSLIVKTASLLKVAPNSGAVGKTAVALGAIGRAVEAEIDTLGKAAEILKVPLEITHKMDAINEATESSSEHELHEKPMMHNLLQPTSFEADFPETGGTLLRQPVVSFFTPLADAALREERDDRYFDEKKTN